MKRHLLIISISWLIPLGLIIALPYLGLTASSTAWLVLILLLCPLATVLVSRVQRGHRWVDGTDGHHASTDNPKIIAPVHQTEGRFPCYGSTRSRQP